MLGYTSFGNSSSAWVGAPERKASQGQAGMLWIWPWLSLLFLTRSVRSSINADGPKFQHFLGPTSGPVWHSSIFCQPKLCPRLQSIRTLELSLQHQGVESGQKVHGLFANLDERPTLISKFQLLRSNLLVTSLLVRDHLTFYSLQRGHGLLRGQPLSYQLISDRLAQP